MIKNIVFDFGGVLVDWNPRYLFKDIFKSTDEMEYFLENICTDEWNLQQDKGRLLSEGTQLLLNQFPEHGDMIRLYYDKWEVMLKSDIPENVEVLTMLKDKYHLLGLTNWSAETFPIALKRFPFFELFEGIVVSGTEKLIKPDKAIFKLLLDRYQITAKESIFIDDNIHNINAALELGFDTIHIHNNMNLKTALTTKNIL